MKILILGSNGQVGFELQRTLMQLGRLETPRREDLDLMNEESLAAYLSSSRPDVIVNAAAWTAVDAAETNQSAAQRLNAALPKQLAQYAFENDIRLIHYSSDYVYPGNGMSPWDEVSKTGPLSVYGKTKLEGDEAIEKSGASYLIFRTSWVYSARGKNFMKTMLNLAKEKAELRVVDDQVGAPTPAKLIAEVTSLAISRNIKSGLYNLATRGEVSWYGFAQEIFRLARLSNIELTLRIENLHAIPSSDYPAAANRPLNSRMNFQKLEKELNISLPEWRDQVRITFKELLGK